MYKGEKRNIFVHCPRGGHFLCKSTIFLNIKQSLSVNDNHGLISHKENEDSRSLFTQFGLKFYVFKNGFFFSSSFYYLYDVRYISIKIVYYIQTVNEFLLNLRLYRNENISFQSRPTGGATMITGTTAVLIGPIAGTERRSTCGYKLVNNSLYRSFHAESSE